MTCCIAALFFVTAFPSACAKDAPSADWWSFRQPTKPALPQATPWCRNEVDRFITAKHLEQGLAPAAEADPRTLLRRVAFDLTGLPPTPEESEAFLQDSAPNAYERVVDRLLASPRYGERWARLWLDTVHYGESHGYDKDKPRLNAWPYRDYVIRAFNTDKPYSRFVEEQLAGDALYPGSADGIAALGFIAAGPWDFVGHVELPITKTDGLVARYNDRDDMVMNTVSTFQSLTVHCARCHDHKFDPITQRDYYGLQAVFAGVDRADRPFDADPETAKRRTVLQQELAALASQREALDKQISVLGGPALDSLNQQIKAAKAAPGGAKAAFGYHSAISPSNDVEKWAQLDLGATRAIAEIEFVGCHDDFNNIGAGFGFPPRYKIEASDDRDFRAGVRVIVDRTREDSPNPGVAPQRVRVNAPARYVRFTATKLAPRQNDYIFALAELSVLDSAGQNLARSAEVTALDSIEAPPRWRKANLIDGSYAGSETNAPLARLQQERETLLRERIPSSLNTEMAEAQAKLEQIQQEIAKLPKPQMVYAAARDFPASGSFLPPKQPRAVHLLKRGDVKKPGEEMKAAGVAAVPGVAADFAIDDPQNEAERRAALARWITHTNNLLTRRSIVNRVWSYHFGRGIVDTPNDFGRMGGLPSHPELLDWLAFWFLDHGESLKSLHRLIVTSATYRQSSQPSPAALSASGADAQNRYLWRMNRARLDAEQFHDAVLSVAGDLDLKMGGPSVQQFAFKDDHSPVYDYSRYDASGPGANRRSIYRFIVRSAPDPFMEALDCPDANALTPARNVTTTALQALATWNDAFVLRECDRLAARVSREATDADAQVSRCFRLILNRAPSAAERAGFAAQVAAHGLASACRVLFNSNEFIFIE